MTWVFCHKGSVDTFLVTKNCNCFCKLSMNSVPGVMQLESNLFSSGKTSPYSITPGWSLDTVRREFIFFYFTFLRASFSLSSASLAERNLLPRCWFILARGATPSIAIKKTFWGLMRRNKTCTTSKFNTLTRSSKLSHRTIVRNLPPNSEICQNKFFLQRFWSEHLHH